MAVAGRDVGSDGVVSEGHPGHKGGWERATVAGEEEEDGTVVAVRASSIITAPGDAWPARRIQPKG